MNMKIFVILVVSFLSNNIYAETTATATAATAPTAPTASGQIGMVGGQGQYCDNLLTQAQTQEQPAKTPEIIKCENLKKIAGSEDSLTFKPEESPPVKSMDGTIECKKVAKYTIDYDACSRAVSYYNFVENADKAMDLQQTVRTDLNSKNLQQEAAQKLATGDAQEAALDAAKKTHEHMKQMHTEKLAAYGIAVASLTTAYVAIPGEKQAKARCQQAGESCGNTVRDFKASILANQTAKSALAIAIMKYTAKAVAAGIMMKKDLEAAKKIAAIKNNFDDTNSDLMVERCAFNPMDPECLKSGNRISNSDFSNGEFGFGADGNNAFDMNPDMDEVSDIGAPTNIGDSDRVSSPNSPFSEKVKEDDGIEKPAAAAQMQASGGAAGGGAGGGSGGGGGGASLGNDIAGVDKDADKEAEIKTNKVSGIYGQSNGAGFKAIGKGKEIANPFGSLFDAKSGGGLDEDRTIASGDIDGAASGLFQKISKRYSQIQADKRIEAKNLE